jgi:hypothetical protein
MDMDGVLGARTRGGALSDEEKAVRAVMDNANDAWNETVHSGVEAAFQAGAANRRKVVEDGVAEAKAESARLLADARNKAAMVMEEAEAEAAASEIARKVQEDRAALEAEKAATEKAHTFQRKRGEEERAQLLAEAEEEAAKVTAAAEAAKEEVERMRRVVEEDRAALEAEKAAMEKAHTFQSSQIILLNVGGHRFETSLQTLTSIPDTYLSSMFSGRFELTPDDDDGAYYIERDGTHFRHILNFLRDPVQKNKLLSSDATEGQREELKKELDFYGLLDRMMPGPYVALDLIGKSLLQRACLAGTERALRTAVDTNRALVFVMGITTPFLNERFQDLRWVITDRVVNGSPVWAAVGREWFMFRAVDSRMIINSQSVCAEGSAYGYIHNTQAGTADAVTPTELPSDKWVSGAYATLATQYASARRIPVTNGNIAWDPVPEMRFTAVHGLDDDDPAMAEALAKLAALEEEK